MAPRATWKGFLKLDEVVCGVALYTAVTASERVSLHMLNRRTGHRLQRRFIDPDTGETVERDQQVKGYEVGSGDYVMLDPEEVAAATPENDKTLSVEGFIPCGQVDDLYFDRPYYLRPADEASQATYAVIREGLRASKVAALISGVLFRRPHTLLLRAHDDGLIATMLSFDYEVRSAEDAFADIGEVKIEDEMLDLARHIIDTKAGTFRPEAYEDRYEAALVELVRAKMEGRKIRPPKETPRGKVVDLMDALRRSAGMEGEGKKAGAKGTGGKSARSKSTSSKSASSKSPSGGGRGSAQRRAS
ncbi:non-homologous end joining protein Ku [Ancylobacter mangrovi]|uniref:non-homologous end joining protein Ku n=1 Tax=Ancylobacter mangrovi TaxID=2972472 RepID=UPI002163FF06|nr:Ku protein [Ancylobacter mangrovi]MCS0501261.1 Ku protein [Ancylobacter mangrovi]